MLIAARQATIATSGMRRPASSSRAAWTGSSSRTSIRWHPLGWEEGNGHQYRWYVPHDVAGLIELMGGREAFVESSTPSSRRPRPPTSSRPMPSTKPTSLDYGNQPSMYIAHLFTYAGAPWLTQKWVRRVMAAAKSDITPYGGYGGDEDQGQMGCLNALMAIGLFNVHGGCDVDPFYEITSPHLRPHHNPPESGLS